MYTSNALTQEIIGNKNGQNPFHSTCGRRHTATIFDFRRLQTDVSFIIWLTSAFLSMYQRVRDTWIIDALATDQHDGR